MQAFPYTGKHMQVQLSTEDMPVCTQLIKSHSLSLKQCLKSVQAVLPSPGFVYWNQQQYLGRRCIAPGTCPTSGIYLTCREVELPTQKLWAITLRFCWLPGEPDSYLWSPGFTPSMLCWPSTAPRLHFYFHCLRPDSREYNFPSLTF